MNVNSSNNNSVNSKINSKNNNMKNEQKNENDEMLNFALKMCSQKIAESAERCVPEYNKFSSHSIAFLIPGTSNVAEIIIKQDEKEYKNQRRVLLGVHHKNSDAIVSNYVFKGTKKEVLEYLKSLSSEKFEETIELIKNLSKESDDYHSRL